MFLRSPNLAIKLYNVGFQHIHYCDYFVNIIFAQINIYLENISKLDW